MVGNKEFDSMISNKFEDVLKDRESLCLFIAVIAPKDTSKTTLSEYFNVCKNLCDSTNAPMVVQYVYPNCYTQSGYLHKVINTIECADIVVMCPSFQSREDLDIFHRIAKYYKKAIYYIGDEV